MTPEIFIKSLEARGVKLRETSGGIGIRPARAVTATEIEVLKTLKSDVINYLRQRGARPEGINVDWSRVSLWQLDRVLEITVHWADVPLILAPGCRIARELRERDSKPGRVWCVCEALDLLLTNVPPDDARKIAEAKLLFGGNMAGVSLGAARDR